MVHAVCCKIRLMSLSTVRPTLHRLPVTSPPHEQCAALQDQHALELKLYKQRVKHLLYEHQGGLARLKADGEVALKAQVGRPWRQWRKRERGGRGGRVHLGTGRSVDSAAKLKPTQPFGAPIPG